MMQSLQAMRPGQQGQQAQNPMQQQMNQLGEMLQRQQRLMDQTFEMGRQEMRRQMEAERGMGENQPGQEGQQGRRGSAPVVTAAKRRRRSSFKPCASAFSANRASCRRTFRRFRTR